MRRPLLAIDGGARTESGEERVTSRVQNEQRMEVRLDAASHDYRHGHDDHNRHELILSGGRSATRTPGGIKGSPLHACFARAYVPPMATCSRRAAWMRNSQSREST